MAVSFSTIPANLRTPLFFAEVDNSQAGYFVSDQRALIVAQMLESGRATPGEIVVVTSGDHADGLFGLGSLAAAMVRAYRNADDMGELRVLPLTDIAGGTAASGTVTVTGTATISGTLCLHIGGVRVQIGVSTGDTAATVAATVKTAVNASGLPVTAVVALGVVTLTCRWKGLTGNDLDLGINLLGPLGGESTPAGLTVVLTAMSGGTGAPDLAEAFSILGDDEYDFVAIPYTDTASLDAAKAEMNSATGRWGYQRQIYGHVFSARRGTLGQQSAFGATRNDEHVSVMDCGADSPTPPWVWAATDMGASAVSLRIDPARPLQTLTLTGVRPPRTPRARLERQMLLFDGIATHTVAADGTVSIERQIATYQTNKWGQADPSYLDVETLYTLAYVIRRLRSVVTQKFARHKLADDGTRFGAGQAIVTPNIIRAELVATYADMERLGIVENATKFAETLIVERDGDDPNRINVLYPPDLVNALRIFAALAQFRLQY